MRTQAIQVLPEGGAAASAAVPPPAAAAVPATVPTGLGAAAGQASSLARPLSTSCPQLCPSAGIIWMSRQAASEPRPVNLSGSALDSPGSTRTGATAGASGAPATGIVIRTGSSVMLKTSTDDLTSRCRPPRCSRVSQTTPIAVAPPS